MPAGRRAASPELNISRMLSASIPIDVVDILSSTLFWKPGAPVREKSSHRAKGPCFCVSFMADNIKVAARARDTSSLSNSITSVQIWNRHYGTVKMAWIAKNITIARCGNSHTQSMEA